MPRLMGGVAVCLLIAATAGAQPVPGQNINMVSGTTLPFGDPYLQKQNEPSIAVSTRNPCHLLGGANDYRTVNIPGLPADKEYGDAWIGLYKSIDCGQTWFSTLVPGYPQDTSAAGTASPVKGLSTGADPTVRAGTSGLFFYSFIAFNRGTNVGKLAVARFVDNNNKETGDPIRYFDTTIWDSGSAGQFIDKPYLAITPNAGTCTIGGQTYPGNTVHLVWSVFVGGTNNIRTKLYYARSSNCGASLDSPPTKLSESYAINQGGTIAVAPGGTKVFVVWRQFPDNTDPSQVLYAYSNDGGNTFTKGAAVPYLSPLNAFDQGTTSTTFRTNAFPTAAADPSGRIYVALSVRGYASFNQARVVLTSTTDGIKWTIPVAIDNAAPTDASHQIMPALTYAGGKLHAVWYDLRDDMVRRSGFSYTDYIDEAWPVRHTLDLRGAQGTIQTDGSVSWQFYDVLQFSPEKTVPRISRYAIGYYGNTPADAVLHQLQFNRPNLKLYGGGTMPFMGDYVDIAGLNYVPTGTPQQWVLNTGPAGGFNTTAAQTVHAAWTDNRDVHAPPGTANLGYAAPGTAACTPQTVTLTGTRNANVYTSRITPGLVVVAPGNSKPTSNVTGGLQRAFAVSAQNRTETTRQFRLTIANQPTSGIASWRQFATPPLQPSDTVIYAYIPGRSSIARTVYLTSTDHYTRITVNVDEVTASGSPLSASTILNPDIQNPDIQNPDIQNPDIQNPDIQNAEVHNPDIQNPDIQNPDIQNPDIQNPDIQNPDIQNPDIQNPDIQNPDIQNPDIQNPDIQNPDIQNPDIQNPDIQNGSITDVSFNVTNNGNTTSSYQVKFGVGGNTNPFLFQIIGRRVYLTPTANGCALALEGQNQTLFNVNNPDLTPGPLPDANLPDATNATVLIRPGETIKVTLRAWDKDVLSGVTSGHDGNKATPFCPMIAGNCTAVTNPVTVTVSAQAANTGSTTPVSTSEPSVVLTDPALAITTSTLPTAVNSASYGQHLQATGGNGTYSWSLYQCPPTAECFSTPPPGLTLSSDGLLSGTPATPGTYVFTAMVASGIQTVSKDITLVVAQPSSNINFTQQPPAIVNPGQAFTVVVQAIDNTGATLPGVAIALGLLSNPTGTTLQPANPTALTNSDGNAVFNITVPTAGLYNLSASATVAGAPGPIVAASNVFNVVNTFMVINTADSGPGSLRQAILDANAAPGLQKIRFNIPPSSGMSIAPQTPLPAITDPVDLDATSQPGYLGSPLVGINGSVMGPGGVLLPPALVLQASDSIVRGLAIYGFSNVAGLSVTGDRNTIQGNYIGTDTSGTTSLGNGSGIVVSGANNLLGGPAAGQGNVVGGNAGPGIVITGSGATGNVVRGSIIGTNPSGTLGVANGQQGVLIANGATSNIVGGAQDNGVGFNEIRGNGGAGIAVTSAGAILNTLRQNEIDGNGGPGIDLGDDGVTANDPGDADSGPNALQNWPVMTAATFTNGVLRMVGNLNSTASTPFSIDYYYSPSCDPAKPQGGRGGFALMLVTNGDGNAPFDVGYASASALTAGYYTAIATRAQNSSGWVDNAFFETSEFSACVPVSVGGTGGSPYAPIMCPGSNVATAFRGRSGDDIDRVELWCSSIDGTAVGTPIFVGGAGSTDTGAPYDMSCPAGNVITGIFGKAGTVAFGGQVVDTLGITCTGLGPSPTTTNVGPVGLESPTSTAFTMACPAGQHVVGIQGRVGVVTDQLAILCK